MFDLDSYLNALILSCRAAFGERLLYVGLQGSYLRGEAHENSDIDVMLILDRFSVRDTCKGVFFLMQNLHYLETDQFILTKKDLKEAVSAEDRRVLELAELPDGFDFDQSFSALFAWCQSAFLRVEQLAKKEYSIRILEEDETDAALALPICKESFSNGSL